MTPSIVSLVLLCAPALAAASLQLLPEYQRPDPFGGIVAADRTSRAAAGARELVLESARGNYVSCHVSVGLSRPGPYRVRIERPAGSPLAADLYREWFHLRASDKRFYPDALIPVALPYGSQLPEPDNRIPGQTAQAFWLDVWIPATAPPGEYGVKAVLESAGTEETALVRVRVLNATVPEEDPVVIDHNTYGSSWFAEYFPSVRAREGAGFFTSDAFLRLVHAYHRIFFEHRGIMHHLGYGHGGKVGPEFAPTLEGSGRGRRIGNWDLYDRHYGPLLDGSAFAGGRRAPRPLPFVYLPVNPEWPASFVNWGEPGYEAEFVNVVSTMERHYREKGWTRTRFEMFFNHKKRYKAFPWDGDETRFTEDYPYFREYRRLLDRAVPKGSPVKFVFRSDVSWTMEREFRELAGVIDFWVCGGGMLAWYKDTPAMLKQRGDIVWHYGGTPVVDEPASTIALDPLRAWIWGTTGYVRWLTTDPGPDPWYRFEGGGTGLVYPGERFGIAGPIPSVRLKIQRNAAADLALLDSFKDRLGIERLRAEAARRFNGTTLEQWWTPRPAIADTPPQDWSNADLSEVADPNARFFRNLDAASWQNVRDYAVALVKEMR